MSQKVAYVFTKNNFTEEYYESLRITLSANCKYAIVGRETGASGTAHLQGYVIFSRRCTFKTCVDRYLPNCHVEVAAGSPDANRRYCSKDRDFWEYGSCPAATGYRTGGGHGVSKRNREEIARDFAESVGRHRPGLVEFADRDPGTFYFSGSTLLRNWQLLRPACDRPDIRVRWFWGAPGVGKSRKAHEELPEAYIKEPRTKWWNNYLFETDVIIDDFGPQGIDINHLLRWFDRYKCYVEIKGGMCALTANNFIITSNFHPSKVFSFGGEEHVQLPALLRRISIEEFV